MFPAIAGPAKPAVFRLVVDVESLVKMACTPIEIDLTDVARVEGDRDETVPPIWGAITEKEHLAYPSGIIHVQIAVDGREIFGAYDNFHRNCVVAYEGFPTALLDRLVANGVIRSYQTDG